MTRVNVEKIILLKEDRNVCQQFVYGAYPEGYALYMLLCLIFPLLCVGSDTLFDKLYIVRLACVAVSPNNSLIQYLIYLIYGFFPSI